MNAGKATAVAVTSSTVTVTTCCFAWSLTRWVDTQALHYVVPLVVTATLWMLTFVFAAGVLWSLATQLGERMASPSPQPGPTPPPDTKRPGSAPIQPRPPKPPRTNLKDSVEVTLVDLEPVQITREIPRVPRHVPPQQLLTNDWRPPVSETAGHR